MKRKSMIVLIILCAGLTLNMDPAPCVCEGESANFDEYFTSWILCVFYGYCYPLYTLSDTTEGISYTAYGENDGQTLNGTWKGNGKEEYYILTFENQDQLTIAQHRNSDDYLLRYDEGTYSIETDKLIIAMENGTNSTLKYVISKRILTLSLYETEKVQ